MKKQILLIVSVVLFGIQIVSAQTPPAPVKQISKGVINGSALNLAKPAYPAAARAVNAEGAVNVQVTIDENGDVVSATAVSGHPLLRAAAAEAARQSKFAPTLLSGQAVKVTGIVVYNFVGDNQSNWFKVGYDLATLQHTSGLPFMNINSIDKAFPADWTAEKEQITRLTQLKAEMSSFAPAITGERKISETTEKTADGATVKKMVKRIAVKDDEPVNSEQIAISQSLISSLQGRLANDELNSWQFNTGVSLNRAVSKLRYTSEWQNVLDALRRQIQTAPEKVSPEFLAELRKIAALIEKPTMTAEDREQMSRIMPQLFRNK